MLLLNIFYHIDEFCKLFEKELVKNTLAGKNKRRRKGKLALSEIITISVFFHHSGYKTFKEYYCNYVLLHLSRDFPNLVSYNRFVELKKRAIVPLALFLRACNAKKCTGTSFVDSTCLKVCHIKRAGSHKTFKGIAKKGKQV